MTYEPRPIDTTGIALPPDIAELTELLARNTHETWARRRLAEGWRYGPRRDDTVKEHPGLVGYDDLSESEKEYDRATATETLKVILAHGYRLERPTDSPLPSASSYKSDRFILDEEVEHLARVQRVGAVEAQVFYAARLLEVFAADAVRALGLEPAESVFSNLEVLQQLGKVSTATLYWAHALRRTGNAVRHVHRRVDAAEAELAVLYAERWLSWFFESFAREPRPAAFRLPSASAPEIRAALHTLEAGGALPVALVRLAPTLPAAAAEILIDRREMDAARTLLDAALAAFPTDLRLRQLHGLWLSRKKRLTEALAVLEPLLEQYEDEETAGITAGVYKRLWLADESKREWLQRSYDTYRDGWRRFGKNSTYLGINTATTALFLGNLQGARKAAERVRNLLLKRRAAGGAAVCFGLWDWATLAEALLHVGDAVGARREYRAAFARHADQIANIEVVKDQLRRLLGALGRDDDLERFLAE